MKKNVLRNERGFTLIEIIAVLVILGILAAVAIPKYLDMRKDAVAKAAMGAQTELNARERLKLAEWKLKDGEGTYPGPPLTNSKNTKADGTGETVPGLDTKLGADWNNNADIASVTPITFQGKQVKFTRKAPTDTVNEPYYWTVVVTD